MLELVHVTKSFESPAEAGSVCVLKDITMNVGEGESLVIVGPSGCGKSTLLNIIGALDRPTDGEVILDGKNLATLDDNELAGIRSLKIGFVFQLHHLLPQCTVLENVLIPTLADKGVFSKQESQQRAIGLLEQVGLKDFLQYRPGELSGGQRQRVALARALINKPKLLLADEPTGSLDKDSSKNVADMLIELNRNEKVTLIAVTHSVELAERFEKIMELNDGVLGNRKIK
jgi:lipoprotein-releasing system ATP-binding protein